MFVILPIRTESIARRTPYVNYTLIGLNLILFLTFYAPLTGKRMGFIKDQYLAFQSDQPAVYQFFTYQFLHASVGHLAANLIFLWVFGNSVNGKLGSIPYLLFYLAGGVFAAWAYAVVNPAYFHLIGASGAIAAVTTAYLALFPRSHVTVLVWFFVFFHLYELPAMLLIGLKVIVWDNIVSPSFAGPSQVAYGAHLAGYLFGFVAALGMLLLRAVPRDQFDILALWKRWYQRREFAAAMADPRAAARAQFGSLSRLGDGDSHESSVDDERFRQITSLRGRIGDALDKGIPAAAMSLYRELSAMDSRPYLPERQLLELARAFFAAGQFADAASAFARFVDWYPDSAEAANVRLLLGIIYARNLHQYEAADRYLTQGLVSLRDEGRRAQCLHWLEQVRAALGRPAPEG